MLGIGRGRRRSHAARAVVTGAGSGIGRAIALELGSRGSEVICVDIAEARAASTADTVQQRGGVGHAVTCDVADRDQLIALAGTARELFDGPTTLLVNNAGVGIGGQRVGEVGFENWDWALGINLWGVINGCEIFMPQLREAGFGGVINTASAAGFAAAPLMGPYNVSKAAVISLSETLSAELAGSGLNVSVLCPTAVRTRVVADGRVEGDQGMAGALLKAVGFPPGYVARQTLNALDRGRLYVVPQPDAKVIWALKRLGPAQYTAALGTGYQALSRFVGRPTPH